MRYIACLMQCHDTESVMDVTSWGLLRRRTLTPTLTLTLTLTLLRIVKKTKKGACESVKDRSARLMLAGTKPAKENPNKIVHAHRVGVELGADKKSAIAATATIENINRICSGRKL